MLPALADSLAGVSPLWISEQNTAPKIDFFLSPSPAVQHSLPGMCSAGVVELSLNRSTLARRHSEGGHEQIQTLVCGVDLDRAARLARTEVNRTQQDSRLLTLSHNSREAIPR